MGGEHEVGLLNPNVSVCGDEQAYEDDQVDSEVYYNYDIFNNMGAFLRLHFC
jgi:hypothetical protein